MFITALDFGSSQIKALVAEIKEDKLSVLGVFQFPSSGIRKGEIVNAGELTEVLRKIFEKIKDIDKLALKNVFVNISSSSVRCQESRGIVAVSRADNEISQDDINRVIKASQAIKLLPNRMIIHTLTKEFIVDGISDVREPLGLTGTRLEVNSLIIDAFTPNVKNILAILESLGASVGGVIYNPLASGRAILTKTQKDLGVVLIDIGFGTTSMSVYEEGKLLHAAAMPVGGGNITNDLAIGLKCSIKAAELIKLFFGSSSVKETSSKEKITSVIFKEKTGFELKEIDRNIKSIISRRLVNEIIEVRLAEIFEFINNELKLIGKAGQLPVGAVLTGGSAKMSGIVDLAKDELKLPAEIALPEIEEMEFYSNNARDSVENLEFSAAVGLLFWAKDQHLKENKWHIPDKFSINKIKNIWRYFVP